MPSVFTAGTFNCWSACIPPHHDTLAWIEDEAHQVDVLAVQEVHQYLGDKPGKARYQMPRKPGHRPGPVDIELYNHLERRLRRTHHVRFVHHLENALHDCEETDVPVQFGNVLLVKRTWRVMKYSSSRVIGNQNINTECINRNIGSPAGRSAHVVTITNGAFSVSIMNGHGLWSRHGKVDIRARQEQSRQFIRLGSRHQRDLSLATTPPFLFLGDLNYTSDMEALRTVVQSEQLFGPGGGVNLNAQFGVTDTRTDRYPTDKPSREADFMIASRELAQRCRVYDVHREVPSDHAYLKAYFYLQ